MILYNWYLVVLLTFKATLSNSSGNRRAFLIYLKHYLKNRDIDRSYLVYLSNQHIFGHQTDFIGKNELRDIKSKSERLMKSRLGCDHLNYDILCKDKFCNTSFLHANGIPVIQNVALISRSRVIMQHGEVLVLPDAFKRFPFPVVIKNTVLEYNEGFNICDKRGDNFYLNNEQISIDGLSDYFSRGNWVVQQKVKSSGQVRKINGSALNTTRIVTVFDGDNPVYLGGFQAFACNQEPTDSWGKGAVYVGINPEEGVLRSPGYFHPAGVSIQSANMHPDSEIAFDGLLLNGLAEAVSLCIRAHRLLYFNFLIGWDVAITDDGPLIVEANENPGMNAVQFIEGGMREKILEMAKRIENEQQ